MKKFVDNNIIVWIIFYKYFKCWRLCSYKCNNNCLNSVVSSMYMKKDDKTDGVVYVCGVPKI